MQAGRRIMEDSQVADWDGFEALLYDILYEQVGIRCSILLDQLMQSWHMQE